MYDHDRYREAQARELLEHLAKGARLAYDLGMKDAASVLDALSDAASERLAVSL